MTAPHVTPEQLAAIPEAHRRLVAVWLMQQAARITGSGWVMGEAAVRLASDCLNGAAVDLAYAGEENEGVDWSNARLVELLTDHSN